MEKQAASQKTVLVTGGTGLVGAHLLQRLQTLGYRNIRAIHRPESRLPQLGTENRSVEWMECDLLDLAGLDAAMEGVQQVYHAAALISFDPRDFKEMRQVNVEGTANIVNLGLFHQIEKLVHVSSVAAIGRSKKRRIISEASKWERSNWNTTYGITKYQAEQEVWRGRAEGLKVAVVNPSIILGPGFWQTGPGRFFPLIDQGFSFFPQGVASLVHVEDVVEAMVRLMESEVEGERFILNAGSIPYRELFRLIATHLQRRPPHRKLPGMLQPVLWRLVWLQTRFTGERALITRETVAQSSRSIHYDNAKSIEQLGLQYQDIPTAIEALAAAYLRDKEHA